MLRRKKKPTDRPSRPGAAAGEEADEALRDFLKDQ
jgi:hypothetical protein